jgi:hypothetical protein
MLTLEEVYDVLQHTVMPLANKMVTYLEGEDETKIEMPLSSYVVRQFGETLLERTNITVKNIQYFVDGDEVPTGKPHSVMLGFGGGSRRRRTVRRSNNALHRDVRRHNVK